MKQGGVLRHILASKLISAIPHGRKGKHNLIVSMILDDLEGSTRKRRCSVPLDSLEGEKMENVRSALNRATRQRKMLVTTATDEKYFYVWRTEPQKDAVCSSQIVVAGQQPALSPEAVKRTGRTFGMSVPVRKTRRGGSFQATAFSTTCSPFLAPIALSTGPLILMASQRMPSAPACDISHQGEKRRKKRSSRLKNLKK